MPAARAVGEVLVLGVEERSDAVELGLAAVGDARVDHGGRTGL